MGKKRIKNRKRGFPIALVLGFGEDEHTHVTFWELFSIKTKPYHPARVDLGQKIKHATEKQIYAFFELITHTYKPLLKSGIQTIMLISRSNPKIIDDYLEHIQKHYRWMTDNPRHPIHFTRYNGRANTLHEISELRIRENFQEILQKGRDQEDEGILQLFEKRIATENPIHPNFLVGLEEIEAYIYKTFSLTSLKPEYLLVTDKILQKTLHKNRLHRLIQIVENKKIKVRVLSSESAGFSRVNQFGGLVLFMESERSFNIRMAQDP